MLHSKKGFTLIELLIVIALLGALAVALLAALDPLEQIKKGTDTGIRNTVTEVHGAFVRYAALQGGKMPFAEGETFNFAVVGTDDAGSAYQAVKTVVDSGELKSDFFELAGKQLESVFITGVNNEGDQYINVCYQPSSKSFRKDVNTKFGSGDGQVSELAGCPNELGTNTNGDKCYWCVR